MPLIFRTFKSEALKLYVFCRRWSDRTADWTSDSVGREISSSFFIAKNYQLWVSQNAQCQMWGKCYCFKKVKSFVLKYYDLIQNVKFDAVDWIVNMVGKWYWIKRMINGWIRPLLIQELIRRIRDGWNQDCPSSWLRFPFWSIWQSEVFSFRKKTLSFE